MSGKTVDSNGMQWNPHRNYPGVFIRQVVDAQTNPLATFNVVRIAPGSEITPHVHDHSAETFLVTAGQALCTMGDTTTKFHAGHLGYAPAGTRHGLKNIGTDDLFIVAVFTPPT